MLHVRRRPAQVQHHQRRCGEQGVTALLRTLLLVKTLEQTMVPHDEINVTYLLVLLAIVATIWWRTALRLVAAFVVVIIIFGVIHLADMLGLVQSP